MNPLRPSRAGGLPALLLGTLLLAACQPPPRGTALFPLDDGRRWTYRVITEREDEGREVEQITLRNLGAETLGEDEARQPGPAWRRRSDSGVDYWLREDASGIYRVASKSDLQERPQPDAQRRYVLKQPLAEGTHWIAETTPYLLQRTQDWPREIRHSHPSLPMSFSIQALGVTARANGVAFEGCVQVEGRGKLHLFVDPVAGFRDVPIVQREWYCPGVGLVRLERDELTGSPRYLFGGRLVMELIEG